MKKLNAYIEATNDEGSRVVCVIDADTGIIYRVTVEAATDKEAAFKAMEQVNDQ